MKKDISIKFLYLKLNWALIQELYVFKSCFKEKKFTHIEFKLY